MLARLDDTPTATLPRAGRGRARRARRTACRNRGAPREAELDLDRSPRARDERHRPARPTSTRAEAEVDALEARLAQHAAQQVTVAERQVALRRPELDDTVIRAPFAGVAISKNAQPGEMISPVSAGGGFTRTGICTIVDMASLEIEVDVNESLHQPRDAGPEGARRRSTPIPTGGFPAHVITIIPTADRQKATVQGAHRLRRSSIRASCPTWA